MKWAKHLYSWLVQWIFPAMRFACNPEWWMQSVLWKPNPGDELVDPLAKLSFVCLQHCVAACEWTLSTKRSTGKMQFHSESDLMKRQDLWITKETRIDKLISISFDVRFSYGSWNEFVELSDNYLIHECESSFVAYYHAGPVTLKYIVLSRMTHEAWWNKYTLFTHGLWMTNRAISNWPFGIFSLNVPKLICIAASANSLQSLFEEMSLAFFVVAQVWICPGWN
jgi:hypothetical protein